MLVHQLAMSTSCPTHLAPSDAPRVIGSAALILPWAEAMTLGLLVLAVLLLTQQNSSDSWSAQKGPLLPPQLITRLSPWSLMWLL